MPGKLDEISEAIGDLRASVRGLGQVVEEIRRDIKDNRSLQSDRHGQNRRDIEGLQQAVRQLDDAIRSSAGFPSLSKGQRAALIVIAVSFLGVAAWLAQLVFGSAISWVLSHLKLGG